MVGTEAPYPPSTVTLDVLHPVGSALASSSFSSSGARREMKPGSNRGRNAGEDPIYPARKTWAKGHGMWDGYSPVASSLQGVHREGKVPA